MDQGASPGAKRNELFDFMRQITLEMASEYARIQKRTSEDPGTAGDEGEENWATVLREWLPGNYHVVTKGRILHHDGVAGPQVDVVVLQPEYPRRLLNKKLYLAGGVAAAFECKLTLRAQHIRSAVENARDIRRHLPQRHGSPYRELNSTIIYGLLAHSHSWTADASTPVENIGRNLHESTTAVSEHPRELLDLVCVADLGTWSASKLAFMGPSMVHDWEPMAPIYGPDGSVPTSYICCSRELMERVLSHDERAKYESMTPLGALLALLVQRIGWENPSVRPLADYFRLAGLWGFGSGELMLWPTDVYTPKTRERVVRGQLSPSGFWDEWSPALW